ncbi:hypothetical protein E2C01_002383 [Portunus trituberculatus]|uniref:Uncharacterized protein n=1 Tax=Portunus trituberculatus TaxID=210409 RepID=A0A5B7CM47_PORTR|nr:hypothetical protein [Portunus trituberculatus]
MVRRTERSISKHGPLSICRHQDEPFLPKSPPQQSCGCESSDDAILPRLTRVAMSSGPPHTTSPATVMK